MCVCGVGSGVAVIVEVAEVIAIALVIVEGFWLKVLCGTESISGRQHRHRSSLWEL